MARYLIAEPNEEGKYEDIDEAIQLAEEICQRSDRIVDRLIENNRIPGDAVSRISRPYTTLGMAHYLNGNMPLALQNLEKASGVGSEEPENWIFLAMTHWRLGEKEETQQ